MRDQQIALSIVTGGFILENFTSGKREVFTSENKLMKAIKDVIKSSESADEPEDETPA